MRLRLRGHPRQLALLRPAPHAVAGARLSGRNHCRAAIARRLGVFHVDHRRDDVLPAAAHRGNEAAVRHVGRSLLRRVQGVSHHAAGRRVCAVCRRAPHRDRCRPRCGAVRTDRLHRAAYVPRCREGRVSRQSFPPDCRARPRGGAPVEGARTHVDRCRRHCGVYCGMPDARIGRTRLGCTRRKPALWTAGRVGSGAARHDRPARRVRAGALRLARATPAGDGERLGISVRAAGGLADPRALRHGAVALQRLQRSGVDGDGAVLGAPRRGIRVCPRMVAGRRASAHVDQRGVVDRHDRADRVCDPKPRTQKVPFEVR